MSELDHLGTEGYRGIHKTSKYFTLSTENDLNK